MKIRKAVKDIIRDDFIDILNWYVNICGVGYTSRIDNLNKMDMGGYNSMNALFK